jgi:hypothetical protein
MPRKHKGLSSNLSIAKNKKKIPGINVMKQVTKLYNESSKTLRKELEEYTRRWKKTSHIHGLAEIVV